MIIVIFIKANCTFIFIIEFSFINNRTIFVFFILFHFFFSSNKVTTELEEFCSLRLLGGVARDERNRLGMGLKHFFI